MRSRGRTRGWIPLAYPKSALVLPGSGSLRLSNPFFPLHKDIVTTSVRELLVLDGTITSDLKIELNKVPVKQISPTTEERFALVPRFLVHTLPDKYQACDVPLPTPACTDTKKKETGKRLIESTETISNKKEKHNSIQNDVGFSINGDEPMKQPLLDTTVVCIAESIWKDQRPTAESIAHVIARRSIIGRLSNFQSSEGDEACVHPLPSKIGQQKRPRIVSDSDLAEYSTFPPTACGWTEQTLSERDLSRFLDLHQVDTGGGFMWKRHDDYPSLFEASIATEASLRGAAVQQIVALTQSFTDTVLHLFLGYKTHHLTRDKLLRVIADFLFDTSHALYAWEETDRELSSSNAAEIQIMTRAQLDEYIRKMLFDNRALRQIGGFAASSMLPQALSIQRLRKDQSWESHAASAEGQVVLHHYRKMSDTIQTGQRRRGQRLRQRQRPEHHRLRSNSTSSETSTSHVDGSQLSARPTFIASLDSETERTCPIVDDETSIHPVCSTLPVLHQLCIAREPGNSWGVLLAREGDLCVVMRGNCSAGSGSLDFYPQESLQSGDLIICIQGDNEQAVVAPSFRGKTIQSDEGQSWFQEMIRIFKASSRLTLTVQRV